MCVTVRMLMLLNTRLDLIAGMGVRDHRSRGIFIRDQVQQRHEVEWFAPCGAVVWVAGVRINARPIPLVLEAHPLGLAVAAHLVVDPCIQHIERCRAATCAV